MAGNGYVTPEREKQVPFTTPYYDNSALFVGQQGQIRQR